MCVFHFNQYCTQNTHAHTRPASASGYSQAGTLSDPCIIGKKISLPPLLLLLPSTVSQTWKDPFVPHRHHPPPPTPSLPPTHTPHLTQPVVMDTWDCLTPGSHAGWRYLQPADRRGKFTKSSPVFGFTCPVTLMPEKTSTQLRQTAQADAGYSPCLFAHVRAFPAVDLEPLPLTPMTNEKPRWILGFCLPSAAVVTGTNELRLTLPAAFCRPVCRPEHAFPLHLLHHWWGRHSVADTTDLRIQNFSLSYSEARGFERD